VDIKVPKWRRGVKRTSKYFVALVAMLKVGTAPPRPIIVDQNNVLRDGLLRLEAHKEAGLTEIECTVIQIPKHKEKT
jgi:hypothetical protein